MLVLGAFPIKSYCLGISFAFASLRDISVEEHDPTQRENRLYSNEN
jgi:hypothetical protein